VSNKKAHKTSLFSKILANKAIFVPKAETVCFLTPVCQIFQIYVPWNAKWQTMMAVPLKCLNQ
jgi:hypothetical protein